MYLFTPFGWHSHFGDELLGIGVRHVLQYSSTVLR